MDKPIIADKGPVGVKLIEGKEYYYCTCGRSSNQPFCDGSHSGTSFSPMAYTATETGTAYLCQCKHAKNAPFCDGSHKVFSAEQVGQEGPGSDD